MHTYCVIDTRYMAWTVVSVHESRIAAWLTAFVMGRDHHAMVRVGERTFYGYQWNSLRGHLTCWFASPGVAHGFYTNHWHRHLTK